MIVMLRRTLKLCLVTAIVITPLCFLIAVIIEAVVYRTALLPIFLPLCAALLGFFLTFFGFFVAVIMSKTNNPSIKFFYIMAYIGVVLLVIGAVWLNLYEIFFK